MTHFPYKEVLAEALIQRYVGIIDQAFVRIDSHVASMPIEELADALLDFMIEIQGKSKAMLALMDAEDSHV